MTQTLSHTPAQPPLPFCLWQGSPRYFQEPSLQAAAFQDPNFWSRILHASWASICASSSFQALLFLFTAETQPLSQRLCEDSSLAGAMTDGVGSTPKPRWQLALEDGHVFVLPGPDEKAAASVAQEAVLPVMQLMDALEYFILRNLSVAPDSQPQPYFSTGPCKCTSFHGPAARIFEGKAGH